MNRVFRRCPAIPTAELEISQRLVNVFRHRNISCVSQLEGVSEMEMLRWDNFGRKSLNELVLLLSPIGVEFAPSTDRADLPDFFSPIKWTKKAAALYARKAAALGLLAEISEGFVELRREAEKHNRADLIEKAF